MSKNRTIFDTNVLKIKQERAKILASVTFVDEFAINQASDILSEIRRKFLKSAIIGRRADFWSSSLELEDVTLIDEAEELSFKGKKFDLIIHALSLHRCNDPIGQLIQVRQALNLDGLMLVFLFGGESLRELRASFEAAEIKIKNGISPRVAPMIEIRDAGDLLVRAGFALSVADKTDLVVSYKAPIDLFYDLRSMAETSIMINRQKNFLRRDTLNKCFEIYSSDYAMVNKERVKATFQLFCLTGWAPSDNQQKPLKPGSATHHFSQVLNTYKL